MCQGAKVTQGVIATRRCACHHNVHKMSLNKDLSQYVLPLASYICNFYSLHMAVSQIQWKQYSVV